MELLPESYVDVPDERPQVRRVGDGVAVRWCKDLKLALPVVAWTVLVEGVGVVSSVISLLNPGQTG